jgi:hypothetical protein
MEYFEGMQMITHSLNFFSYIKGVMPGFTANKELASAVLHD